MMKKIKNISAMREDVAMIFKSGVAAVDPYISIKKYCKVEKNRFFAGFEEYDLSKYQNIYVIGFGKAAAPMAVAMEDILENRITDGMINIKYGHTAKLKKIRLLEAGHPVPDENGEKGAKAIVDLAQHAEKDDLVICLISGGGSALLPLPVKGITLKDKQETIKVLLSCGATINEINSIRKHMSTVKGGRLARIVHPATLVTMMLSDVVGDDMDVISSGPTVPDPSTFEECIEIIKKFDIKDKIPESVVNHLQTGALKKISESPKPGDPVFSHVNNLIVGNNMDAILSAKKEAERLAYNTLVLSSMIEGETRHVAKVHTAIAREILKTGFPVKSPACIISGGETTVTITGKGKGGRNQEFVLAALIDISEEENIVVASGGTDGNDGPTDAAGAIADTYTMKRAVSLGLDPYRYLVNNDSYHFFEHLNDLLMTGPTNTNVMDLRIILIV